MAQNMNNIQYTLMPAGGPQQAPAGETYQLPANSLIGEISHRSTDRGKISEHKLSIGIPAGDIGDSIYSTWQDTVKNQILARGYLTDLHYFPVVEFQQIIASVRRLRPACDALATVLAVNDIPRMQEVDEAVVQLVKDCGKKLTNTIKRPNKPFPQVPGVPPAQVRVSDMLLPANAPPGASGVLQQLCRMQALGPQMLHQPVYLGQLKSNLLPRLLVHTKTLLPRRIPKGQSNFLC